MRILLDTSLGIYCWGQTQLSIFSLKLLKIAETQEERFHYNIRKSK